MKLFRIVFLFAFLLSVFASCKKDKDPITVPPANAAGKYEGKYGTGNNVPSVFYSFDLKQNGTLDELDEKGEIIGTGTWKITGSSFTASTHYKFPATSFFALTAFHDASAKKLTGTWGYGSNDKDGGKWHMTKK